MFIPDDGYTIFDIDLDSADLRVVVWESDCKEMKRMFAEGLKPYVEIAKEYYHDPTITKKHPSYQAFKKFCHGTNYLGQSRTLAPQCNLLLNEADRLQKWYFGKFPEIKRWQDRLRASFMSTGTVRNAWGYRCKFYDRLDEPNLINKAVAWIPQSTVGLLINHIWLRIDEELPEVLILLQMHDSLVGQFPTDRPELVDAILACGRIAVPYPDPLYIPLGLKTSTSSWGECT